jgi:hypothetical protein
MARSRGLGDVYKRQILHLITKIIFYIKAHLLILTMKKYGKI